MQNVEFKAELRDLLLARSIALTSGAIHALSIRQVDTYYRIADARLKRRQTLPAPPTPPSASTATHDAAPDTDDFADFDRQEGKRTADTEFIYYDRANKSGPRLSHFTIYTPQQAAERFGINLPDPWVVVRKRREVFLLEGVRIHLDRVQALGDYIEFEAPIAPDRKVPNCFGLVDRLREVFRPAMGEPIDCSYSDLLTAP